ncbi:hypothetical protein [Polynucleobacter sp. AM-25C3]|uniref:hypothetical protein n=1 Tax=Polynucleobacter sp. AM-25C3 TaxID=1855569 RepID=UPI001C0CF369|nr:hypothetical protein [Polynucleobacter sp. AM-25C3]MBU3601077.1 hypothetical protein [Polynucleobacter sp. AM-25C3]
MRLIALLLLLIPIIGHAFEPLNTDDAGTVPKDRNQIEQYYFTTASHGGGTADTVDIITPGEEYFGAGSAKAFPFTYTRGITENLEASLGATYFAIPRGNYSPLSNKVIAFKWRFAEDDQGKWALAIKPSLTLPGSQQQQAHGLDLALPNYGLNLIGSRYWDEVELHLNASYMKSPYNTNYPVGMSSVANRTNILFFSAAPVWTVVKGVRLALDAGITTNPPSSEQYLTSYALLAGIFSVADDLDIGLSYMRSAANMGIVISNSGVSSSRSEIGFTWRFQ